jgi:hypothetical protein
VNIWETFSQLTSEYLEGRGRILSFLVDLRSGIRGNKQRLLIKMAEPINLKVYLGGIMLIICAKSARRCLRGYVSTRKATFIGSYRDTSE